MAAVAVGLSVGVWVRLRQPTPEIPDLRDFVISVPIHVDNK